jgi:tetratricopeptide (TPR) repeat protein
VSGWRIGFGTILPAWLARVALAAGASAAAAQISPIEAVPEPSLAGMEEAVRGQLAEARADLEASLVRAGGDASGQAETFGDLGRLYLAYDLVEPAAACLRNAWQLAPGDFRWPYLLAGLYQNERRLEEASAAFAAALELEPDDLPALIRQGNVQLGLGLPVAARRNFERAARVDPGSAAALAGLGRAAAALGENQAAIKHFEAALVAQPTATALRHPLGLAYRELGRMDEAREQLAARGTGTAAFRDPLVEGLLQLATGAGVHLMLANRALRQGSVEAAIERYQKALEADPGSATAHQALGGALSRRGDLEGAVRHYSAALAIQPDNPPLHYNLGTVLVEQGADEQAVRHFRAAIAQSPDFHNARFNLAATLARMGRLEEALAEYRLLGEQAPTDTATRYYTAQTLRRLGRYDEAGSLFAALVAEDAGRARSRADLAATLAARGRFVEAVVHYDKLLESAPDDGRLRLDRAMALLLGGDYPTARRRLEEDVARLSDDAALRHALARLLATCPDPELRDGERALTITLALFSDSKRPEYAETVAMALAELGRFAEAIEWQRRLILETERAGRTEVLPRLRRTLESLTRREPVRPPWLETSVASH